MKDVNEGHLTMTRTMKVSATGFILLLIGFIFLGFALNRVDSLRLFGLMVTVGGGAVVLSYVLIVSLRCPHCGERLNIVPFPMHSNPLPNFFLWTGLEARCGSCRKVIR